MKRLFALSLFIAVGFFLITATVETRAASPVFEDVAKQLGAAQEETGLPKAGGRGAEEGLPLYVAKIINGFLGILGTVAVVLIIYAGFKWMTAGGNEEEITKAKSLLTNAAIGLAIILLAYGIASFIFRTLLYVRT